VASYKNLDGVHAFGADLTKNLAPFESKTRLTLFIEPIILFE